MKILTIGDIVGENGIQKVKKQLPIIQEAENIDVTIVNAENAGGGMGLTSQNYNELCKMNIDMITMGDHTWGKKDIFKIINNENIVRPANYPKGVPGYGYRIIKKNDKKIAVINLLGRTFINVLTENPFLCVDRILEKITADIIIVDFHAEATAEKIAMGRYLDGRITGLYGTHTHVQTADEQILKKGTGYITDVGMTGPADAVIGMDADVALKRFLTTLPERYKLASGDCILNGAIFEIDDETCQTKKVYRISC